MLYRPHDFSEVIGQTHIIDYLLPRITENSLPDFILLHGEEGLGKTTIAKLIGVTRAGASEEEVQAVIEENRSTANTVMFSMAPDNGRDAVKEVLAQFNLNFAPNGIKTVIVDEAQCMSAEVQNMLLTDSEYLPKGLVCILLTTNVTKISKTLASRAVPLTLKRLTRSEMYALLTAEANRRGLDFQNMDSAFEFIIAYADNKPRKALKVLEAMGRNRSIPLQGLKDFLGVSSPATILRLLSAFSSSLYEGLESVYSTEFTPDLHRELLAILSETIKFRHGLRIVRYSTGDISQIKLSDELLLRLLYDIANVREFNESTMLAVYLRLHPQSKQLEQYNPAILSQEQNATRRAGHVAVETAPARPGVKRLDDLLREAEVVTDGEGE